MSIICTPPLPIEARKPAMFAAVNIRFLKRSSRNIGSETRLSTNGKGASRANPAASEPMTQGLPQPMDEVPYGFRA